MAKTHWMSICDADSTVEGAAGVCRRMLEILAEEATAPKRFLERALSEIATAIAARWTAVLRRGQQWHVVCEIGSVAGHQRMPPPALLNDVSDQARGGLQEADGDRPAFAVAPLDARGESGELLAVAIGQMQGTSLLGQVVAAAQYLGMAWMLVQGRERLERDVQQQRALLAVARRLSAIRETEPLLARLAEEAARLLGADRASIFLWDEANSQLVARPALGVEGGELRLADNRGIVGQVVQTAAPVRINDAYAASDFNPEVDQQLKYETRNLICVPLLDPKGRCVGAFEVLNKQSGAFCDDDVETLAALASLAAIALESAQEREVLIRAQQQMTEQAAQETQIIGDSPAIEALRSTIVRVGATELPVLVLGESGTGKEVVSRAIHYQSARRDRPLLPVNCAALSESLLESELFGHEKGAFTDARETREGKFELASGGTLFLDEIGDLSPGGQAKLLRVLEEKIVYRVGGSQPIHTDVRVIAATNRDLAEAVGQRKFRQDLFFRLSVVTLPLPALRERPDDILPLAEFFLDRFCRDARRKRLRLSVKAKRRLEAHTWPGNVRELRNLMERIAFLCPGPTIEVDELAFILAPAGTAAGSGFLGPDAIGDAADLPLSSATDRFQREYIESAIGRGAGNMTDAAKALGLHRSNLYRKMRQLGMETTG